LWRAWGGLVGDSDVMLELEIDLEILIELAS
jgi:hypothetical protein